MRVFQLGFCDTVVKGSGVLMGAFCKVRKSETSIYPAFEVILRKTLEQHQRLYSALEHPGRTVLRKTLQQLSVLLFNIGTSRQNGV